MVTQKIMVRICMGTACFVQGGADLLLYGDFLDSELQQRIEVEGVSCLGCCKEHQRGLRPPYVQIGEQLHAEVDQTKFILLIKEALDA
ncbi:MAG: NAD(P)H-dependent oxidoreductase subunit E [Sphaerochaetaceae bacterium]|jgi:NADH:ubiquinone oxidoreductase subunit E